MNTTKVSFVLPAYKRAYLHKAITSILAQTYADFELIVVDDVSPENLKEVVDEFQDKRLVYHRNKENLGGKNLAAAWNHAMEFATGEWCILASDDDLYMPTYLETLVSLSKRYPNVDLFHCRIACMDENDIVTSIGEYRNEWESCWEMLYYRGVRRSLQMAPEFMFRREALKRNGGFVDFPLAIFSDDATWYSIAQEHGCVCAPQCLFYWRMSGQNICTRLDNMIMKAKATLLFFKWLNAFMESLPVLNQDDTTYRLLVLKNIASSVWAILDGFLKPLHLPQWLKAIKELSIEDVALRKRLWRNRLKRLWMLHW